MDLFQRLCPSMVERDPFPHALLPVPEAAALAACFPEFGHGFAPATKHLRRGAALDGVGGPLRALLDSHVRPAAFAHLLRVFAEDIRREYPGLRPEAMSIGRRNFDEAAVLLDAQLGVLASTTRTAAERGPHVKGPDKLFEAQLLLPMPEDDAPGGDLVLYGVRRGHSPRFGARHQTPERGLAVARTVPYRAGVLAVWLNTARSITAVTPRGPSPWPVRFVGLLAQLPAPLFALPAVRPTFWGWLLGRSA